MKKETLILFVILFLAVIGLYVLHFTSARGGASASADLADSTKITVDADQRIVYVNIDSVMSNYDMAFDLQKELESDARTSEARLASKERDLQQKFQDYQYKAERGLITRSEAQQIEQSLQYGQQEFAQLQQSLQIDLQNKQVVANNKILEAINQYLESLKDEYHFEYVLGRSFGGQVLYANEQLNITQSVIAGLNAEYIASKSADSEQE